MLMNQFVTRCNDVAHQHVFNGFWKAMELYDIEEYNESGFGYTSDTMLGVWDLLIRIRLDFMHL